MKQNVFDVLMYLFENYMEDEIGFDEDQDALQEVLLEAGFRQNEIRKAFDWLEGLAELQDDALPPAVPSGSLRLYSDPELEKINTECRGFILFMEQMGVLDSATREMVIDRVMALEEDEVDLEQLKWVILMVLFNQPGHEAAFAWMEDLVLDETAGVLH
jgi:Smg protein